MPPKRKNIFLDTYENEFEGIKRSKKGETTCYCKCKNNVNDNENKGPEFAHCVPCNDEINLTSIGKPAIDQHQKTEKHKKAAKAANTTKGIAAFLPSTSAPTNFHRQIFTANNIVAFCADNCSTNFGSAEHGGENNLFFKLNQNRANLLPVGCPAHILHNSARHAADNLPIDIEAIIFKLTSHFKFSTKRTEKFRELCANFEVKYYKNPIISKF